MELSAGEKFRANYFHMITSTVYANSCSRNATAVHQCPDCPRFVALHPR